jgi:thiol peroxidase
MRSKEDAMRKVTFKGTQIDSASQLPRAGATAPGFNLTTADLSDKGLADFRGKAKILNIVPRLDIPVCAESARKFNEEISRRQGVALLNISADLPFAQERFCESNGLLDAALMRRLPVSHEKRFLIT